MSIDILFERFGWSDGWFYLCEVWIVFRGWVAFFWVPTVFLLVVSSVVYPLTPTYGFALKHGWYWSCLGALEAAFLFHQFAISFIRLTWKTESISSYQRKSLKEEGRWAWSLSSQKLTCKEFAPRPSPSICLTPMHRKRYDDQLKEPWLSSHQSTIQKLHSMVSPRRMSIIGSFSFRLPLFRVPTIFITERVGSGI